MTELSVEVRDHDIIISSPETGHSVTYRRVHHEPHVGSSGFRARRSRHGKLELPRASLESRLLKS
jgi:hypothetical protein